MDTDEALYIVSLAHCNSSQPQQFWLWTTNDTIINAGSYLCLTTVDGVENDEDDEEENLALMPCLKSNRRQKWNCAGEYIEQPTSGKCLTASGELSRVPRGRERNDSVETREKSDDVTTSKDRSRGMDNSSVAHENSAKADRYERDASLKEMVEELGQFLQERNETIDEDWINASSNTTENGSTVAMPKPMVSVQQCSISDDFQVWAGVPKNEQVSSSIDGHDSICSQNGTTDHNLSPCYANNMESIQPVESPHGYSYMPEEWLVCDKQGYYVTGFYHTSHQNAGHHEREGLVTGMQCCATSSVFTGEPDSPPAPSNQDDDCDEVEWWSFEDVLISEGWFSCPKGKFLKGVKVGPSSYHHGVHRIYKALCCRPRSASDIYEHCYTDRSRRMDDTGIHGCRMDGYLVTAMYLSGCVEEGSECSEQLTCCIES